jgi:hypothetical protein
MTYERRGWMGSAALLVGGAAVVATPLVLFGQAKSNKKEEEEEVSPSEDLMREHGVLKRVLLIYREVINRIDSKRDFQPDV